MEIIAVSNIKGGVGKTMKLDYSSPETRSLRLVGQSRSENYREMNSVM